jgi:hypothetical protein
MNEKEIEKLRKQARDDVRCELIFAVMKRRDQGIYEETDEYIMSILDINAKELSEYKLKYLKEKHKKITAKDKMDRIVKDYKMNRSREYFKIKKKIYDGETLEEALNMSSLTREEFERMDPTPPELKNKNPKNILQYFFRLFKK